ncbi:HAD family hydrolase [Streptomyces sp. NPDC102270]|uniref:HAD family hydrolase n=1 Tax=Streptomyces sp. NPDC102270 TaxID=3366150 RepID=UPI00383062F9
MQQLVLFDLDNTLVDRQIAFCAWAREFAAERGFGEEAARWLVTVDARGVGPRDQFFCAVRERFGLAEPAEALWGRFRSRMPELVECRPEVLEGLSRMRASRWRVGIVSNGMADNQLAKIERTGLSEHVDARCVSGEGDIRKPDIRIFQLAAERCGSDLSRGGWMVGDNPEHDIAGGRAAGLQTVWIAGQQDWPAGEPEADHTVADAAAAISFLQAEPWHGRAGRSQCRSR